MDILKLTNIFVPICISFIALVYTIKQFNLDKKIKIKGIDEGKKEKYKKRLRFGKITITTLSSLLFIALILTGFYINSLSTTIKAKKERIVLLLPIDSQKEGDVYDDGERQALGLIHFLKNHNEKASNYNFVIRNHGMDSDITKSIVIEEFKRGTKYFICTMSKVSIPLTKQFDSLASVYFKDSGKPLLVSTVSSAPSITNNLKENSVYRFYIRSDEEGAELAKAAHNLGKYKSATSIYVDDDYGKGAKRKFREEWEKLGNFYNNGIDVGALWDEKSIYNKIEEQIERRYKPENREVVFIAHYGGGLDKIINSVYKLNMRPLVVATSTLSIKSWQRPIREPLDSLNWITCVPKMSDDENNLFNGDVVQDFVYFTLDRLITILERCEKTEEDFDTVWHDLYEPNRIDYEILSNGDSKINLKIDLRNYKN